MPLSSVVGAQSIVRPGVCTSSTRPASPYDGQVIYETDTDKTLVWNGSGWVFLSTSRANPGGLDFIKAQTIGSAVSSVTVSDVFSSTYDNYLITVVGGVGSTGNYGRMTLGSTSTNYYQKNLFGAWSNGTITGVGNSNISYWDALVRASTDGIQGHIELYGPNLAKVTGMLYQNLDLRTAGIWESGGGYLNDTTQYTAFTLTTNSGTWTGGTIRVYGYVNS